jgi:hypothetical protein
MQISELSTSRLGPDCHDLFISVSDCNYILIICSLIKYINISLIRFINIFTSIFGGEHIWIGEAESNLDWGHTSKLYVSIKPSSLYSQATPADFNSFIKVFSECFAPILRKFKEIGAPDYLPAPAVSGLCVLRHDHG